MRFRVSANVDLAGTIYRRSLLKRAAILEEWKGNDWVKYCDLLQAR